MNTLHQIINTRNYYFKFEQNTHVYSFKLYISKSTNLNPQNSFFIFKDVPFFIRTTFQEH